MADAKLSVKTFSAAIEKLKTESGENFKPLAVCLRIPSISAIHDITRRAIELRLSGGCGQYVRHIVNARKEDDKYNGTTTIIFNLAKNNFQKTVYGHASFTRSRC